MRLARRSRDSGSLVALLAVVLVLATLAGCGSTPKPQPPTTYFEGQHHQGLLSTESGSGTFAFPARPGTWSATVGSFELCVTRPHAVVHITGVRVIPVPGGAKPLSAGIWLRTTTPGAVRATPVAQRRGWMPLGSVLGAPPHWNQPYAAAAPPGVYSRGAKGLTVRTRCRRVQSDWMAIRHGRAPATPLHELLATLSVGARGGEIEGFVIRYRARGQRAELRVRWHLVGCGTAIHSRNYCAGPGGTGL